MKRKVSPSIIPAVRCRPFLKFTPAVICEEIKRRRENFKMSKVSICSQGAEFLTAFSISFKKFLVKMVWYGIFVNNWSLVTWITDQGHLSWVCDFN